MRPSPTPDQLRDLARRHGLTGAAAAELVHVDSRTWRRWVGGERHMPPGLYELLLIKVGEA